MKVSLITTTYNEEANIQSFLTSILKQTKRPDEIVIVDSKSTDNTPEILTQFSRKSPIPIQIITKKSIRSAGRNLAISRAKYSVIAVADAGCILDKHWLDRITRAILLGKADTVAGYYLPITPTYLSKAIAPFVSVMPSNFDPCNYLPSSRSVAFTKQAWIRAGKYPTHLNYCEDLVFAHSLKENTLMMVEPSAIVYWLQKESYLDFFWQLYHYAWGDVEANYMPHLKKIATVYLRYVIFFLMPPLFLLYLFVPILKHARHLDNFFSAFYLPPLQITADAAVIGGSLRGYGQQILRRVK